MIIRRGLLLKLLNTIYRPSIQVLPAPTLSNLIQYSHNFNMGINSALTDSIEYEKNLYDTMYTAADFCSTPAPQMSIDTGSSRYYSPNNLENGYGFASYIP